jgi:membrane protein YdbS with pleckstrin-like domain
MSAVSIPGKDAKGPNPYRMVVMQPGEEMVCVINRHPIGIVQQYVGVLFAIIVACILVLMTIPGKTSAGIQTIFYVGLFVLVIILIAVLGVATKIYWENRWVITTDSLTQIVQGGLFGTQASALSLESLENITVAQQGILMHMFNYGTLEVETTSEHSKFRFIFCPEPVEYARKIINAKEEYLASKK